MFISNFLGRIQLPSIKLLWAAVVVCCFFVVALVFNTTSNDYQQFAYQADAYLHGQFHFRILPDLLVDVVEVDGRYYWPLAPLPALSLVPLVVVHGIPFSQNIGNVVFVTVVLSFAGAMARRYDYAISDALWLAVGFVFASVYAGIAYQPHVGQFASALAALLSLATLYEYLGKRRFWLLGCLVGALFATRFTAGLVGLLVFFDTLLDGGIPWRSRVQKLARFLVPITIVGALLLWYNYARFGNPFDNGYMTALIRPEMQVNARAEYGLFNLRLIPSNLYHYFLAPPQAVIDPHTMHLVPPYLRVNLTMGFFLLSPIFLTIFFGAQLRDRFLRLTAIVALFMTVVLLSYYAVNYFELGPRYLVDVLPLYYVLLLASFPGQKLLTRHRFLIFASAVFNVWMFMTHPSFLYALSNLPR